MADTKTLHNERLINKAFEKLSKINNLKTLEAFGQIGESVTNEARLNADYQNQTSNLRNSTGYVIYEGSNKKKQDFGGAGGEGSEGKKIGLEVAIASKTANKDEIELIIDSGMEYSDAVESKGKTVLSAFIPTAIQTAKKIENYYK